jgi:hypothetical protein
VPEFKRCDVDGDLSSRVGASFEERSSASSEGSSSNLNPCWGDVCVKRMLRAAWVDMVGWCFIAAGASKLCLSLR